MARDEQRLTAFLEARNVDLDSHEAVFQLIRTAAILVNTMEAAALRPLGLTHASYRLMLELWMTGPLELHELAGFMTVSRPTIVGTVNTLVRSGLVVRSKPLADRRRVMISLTEAGRQLIQRADPEWRRWQVLVTSCLAPEEKRTVADLARRISGAIEQLRASNEVQ